MEYDELKDILKLDIPKPSKDFNKILNACKKNVMRKDYRLTKTFTTVAINILITLIAVLITMTIDKKNYDYMMNLGRISAPGNVDMGKNSHLATQGLDVNNVPIFDRIIVWGPELASGTFSLSVITNSNLLKKDDIDILKEYEKEIKIHNPSQTLNFQIAFGIKDSKDYIYLINYMGYVEKEDKEIYKTFVFESNLSYSFSSIVSDFEKKIGQELTDEFLNDSYYDEQNLLVTGIVLGFIEKDGFYKEYFLVKSGGEVFVINK